MLFEIPSTAIDILEQCLNGDPQQRPKMAMIINVLSKILLYEKHQAVLTYRNDIITLDSSNKTVTIGSKGLGKVTIEYDGYRFFVKETDGNVFFNNMSLNSGSEIPGSCIIALGSASMQGNRVFITFDMSNPEVMP